jgi:hypothetical protein
VRLDELQFAVEESQFWDYAYLKRSDGMTICFERGTPNNTRRAGVIHVYLMRDCGEPPSNGSYFTDDYIIQKWTDLEPISAQAVLYHLLGEVTQ